MSKLIDAAKNGDVVGVRRLLGLDGGAGQVVDVNSKDKDGNTALHKVIYGEHRPAARGRAAGSTHIGSVSERVDIIGELIDAGADPTIPNEDGRKPIDVPGTIGQRVREFYEEYIRRNAASNIQKRVRGNTARSAQAEFSDKTSYIKKSPGLKQSAWKKQEENLLELLADEDLTPEQLEKEIQLFKTEQFDPKWVGGGSKRRKSKRRKSKRRKSKKSKSKKLRSKRKSKKKKSRRKS